MIILHSKKLLEQLSEIENLIKQFEGYLEENQVKIDREKILLKIIEAREVKNTSRTINKEN